MGQSWDEHGNPVVSASGPRVWDEHGNEVPSTLESQGSSDAESRGAGTVPPAVGTPSVNMRHHHFMGIGSADDIPDPYHVEGKSVQTSTPMVGPFNPSMIRAFAPTLAGYGAGIAGHALGLPDWANVGLSALTGLLTHRAAGMATDPAIMSAVESKYPVVSAMRDRIAGPVQGPEVAPKGFQSPYPTLPYEAPLSPLGPRPAFQGHDFTPPVFSDSSPVGRPGAMLPSGSVVGPAPPSRVNPPLPRGNAPRVPGWQQIGTTGQPPAIPEFEPTYPTTPMLESGHVIGPRPTLMAEPNRGTVINGPASQQSAPTPVPSQPELDTLNQQLRDSLKARGVSAPDAPSSVRERANTSRAKFDENGKRNQLKSK